MLLFSFLFLYSSFQKDDLRLLEQKAGEQALKNQVMEVGILNKPEVEKETIDTSKDTVDIPKDTVDIPTEPINTPKVADGKKVYLTFDDGPSANTDKVLDILKKNNLKATFFVVAKEGEKSKARYQRIVNEGHTLAMHSFTHDYNQIYRSEKDFIKDIEQLSDFLYDTAGVRPTIYRFPGGSSNSVCKIPMKKLIHYLNEKNITYYDWNALSGDSLSKTVSPTQLNNNILKDVKRFDNCIVLMHDLGDRDQTVKGLQSLIDQLKAMDCQILPIDETTPVVQHVKNDGK